MPVKSGKKSGAASGAAAAAGGGKIDGTKEVAGKELILFYHGPFSQWAPAEFESDDFLSAANKNTHFYNAEQYMMAAKAHLFGDPQSLELIMSTKNGDPRTVKALGRGVKGFDGAKWDAVCRSLVTKGNVYKFGQNKQLRAWLLGTGEKTLAEASPSDKIWGIGMRITDPAATDRSQWAGTNYLGICLMEARKLLRAGATGAMGDSKSATAAAAAAAAGGGAASDSKSAAAATAASTATAADHKQSKPAAAAAATATAAAPAAAAAAAPQQTAGQAIAARAAKAKAKKAASSTSAAAAAAAPKDVIVVDD